MNIWYKRLLLLMAAYLLQRVLFIVFNLSALQGVPSSEFIFALLEGVRFDLCVVATINVPLIAIHFLRETSLPKRAVVFFDHFIGSTFLAVNIPLIIFGIIDSRLFAFTGRRTSIDLLAIGSDIKGQAFGILSQYWYLTVPGLLVVGAFAWLTWQRNHDQAALTKSSIRTSSPMVVVATIAAVLMIRGGLQTKPLSPAHAFTWQPAALANMVLNSGMTVLRTPPSAKVSRYTDFASMADVQKILSAGRSDLESVPLADGRNVVILLVESLATEYVGFLNNGNGYTPFIDELSKNAITFTISFANGRRSIDAMPAIFAGIPAWRDQPFVTSPFAANDIRPAPKVLAAMGYSSMFLHGAANGSMHFDVFAKMAGFDEYIGRNEYPNSADDDGHWGIYDEPFLKFAINKFTAAKKPFFAGIFTLSSHNPFSIPEKYKGRFPKGTLPIHESIGYTDFALSEFFKEASKESWFNNTIFVITGDHTSLSDNPAYANMPGRFRVPIMFYDPTGSLPHVESTKIASHIDITPTILDLLGARVSPPGLFGGSLFDRSWQGRFVQEEYGTWYYNDGVTQIKMRDGEQPAFSAPDDFAWSTAKNQDQVSDSSERLKVFKAVRQYYSNGLLDNNWYRE